MKDQQVKDCGQIMSSMASALFEEHAGTIIERVEEVQLETDGGTGQVTVPLRMEVAFDGKEFSFRAWIDWKKTIKERFSVEPVTYNPNTEQLSLPLNEDREQETDQQQGLKLVGGNKNSVLIDKDSFYARICGKGEKPLQLVESELDQYFASCGGYYGWLDLVDGSNNEKATAIMSDDTKRDDFIYDVKTELYPLDSDKNESTGPVAEKKTRKPRTPKAPVTPERCANIHSGTGLQCTLNAGHEGNCELNMCQYSEDDGKTICILVKGHEGDHKFANKATL